MFWQSRVVYKMNLIFGLLRLWHTNCKCMDCIHLITWACFKRKVTEIIKPSVISHTQPVLTSTLFQCQLLVPGGIFANLAPLFHMLKIDWSCLTPWSSHVMRSKLLQSMTVGHVIITSASRLGNARLAARPLRSWGRLAEPCDWTQPSRLARWLVQTKDRILFKHKLCWRWKSVSIQLFLFNKLWYEYLRLKTN